MVMNVRYSVIISFALWITYHYMQKGFSIFSMKEGMEDSSIDLDLDQQTNGPSPSINMTALIGGSPANGVMDEDQGDMQPEPIYYEPGTVTYGGLGYVPSLEEIAYNNNSIFQDKPQDFVDQDGENGGFCNKSDVFGIIEEKCNALSNDVCATTNCCVLIGGTKCVQGNETGPKKKSVYSDTTIMNHDVYYYQGKCYGNCTK